jgi:uncharacterized phage protein (predicted DNA packaging)
MILTVEDLKKHLNIDHDEDDAYIEDLISVALDAVETYLNRPIDDFVDADGKVKPAVRHSCRLLVGTWYANRESVVFSAPSELPDGVIALLMPLRRFVSPSDN